MLNMQVSDLKRVSKVYRERMIAAGITTVQDIVDHWDDDILYDAIAPKWKLAKDQIEWALKEGGFEIIPRYELRILRK